MSEQQTFIRVLGERNTGTRALIKMMRAQPNVRLFPHGEGGVADLPQYRALKAQVTGNFSGEWAAIYADALRDMAFADACPTKLWKHSLLRWHPAFAQKRAHIVYCVRDPYSWVISLARNPYHKRGPLPDTLGAFVNRPWLTLGRDFMAPVLESPMALWNGKNAGYVQFAGQAALAGVAVRQVRFEDFVQTPETVVAGALQAFDVPFSTVERLEYSTKGDRRTATDIAAYHAREGWTAWLTRDVVGAINALVDWDLAAVFGYERRDPGDYPAMLPDDIRADMRARIGAMGR